MFRKFLRGAKDLPQSLMSEVKQQFISLRTGVKSGYAVNRAGGRTEPEDVSEQALMRGLDTAFPRQQKLGKINGTAHRQISVALIHALPDNKP
jgi:hypothetical protein